MMSYSKNKIVGHLRKAPDFLFSQKPFKMSIDFQKSRKIHRIFLGIYLLSQYIAHSFSSGFEMEIAKDRGKLPKADTFTENVYYLIILMIFRISLIIFFPGSRTENQQFLIPAAQISGKNNGL